jgi:hypothetical protein
MGVQEIEVELGHLAGGGHPVGRVLEEGVLRDGDLVPPEALGVGTEAEGRAVAEEADLVAAVRQRHPELRGHDAAPAGGGIAEDSDLHRGFRMFQMPDRRISA